MGSHRADVDQSGRPSESVTPYVGKRRAAAAPVEEPAAPTAHSASTSYVGKRRAAVAEPDVVVESIPSTDELVAIASLEMSDTAPRPRVVAPLYVHPHDVPVERRAHTHESIAHLFADDSRVDIPVVGLPTDFSIDQTAVMPLVVDGGKRKGDRRGTTTRRRRRPSLPLLAGVASLAIAVTGVMTTGHASTAPLASSRLMPATALGGHSGAGSVGSRDALSRAGDRDGFSAASVGSLAAARLNALKESDAQAGSYDAQLLKNQWGLPIAAGVYHLTGRFGDVSGLWATVHTGLDFACGYGTPIHAVASGVITSTAWDGPYGNKTVETLPDGTELWYAHQESFNVSPGQKVAKGAVIGFVGATGNVTGPHVHLEVRPGGGDPVDPDTALRAHGVDPDANQ